MSMNANACSTCAHFDRIIFGDDTRKSRHGWCSIKSIYPHKEQEGQIFPQGVKRAAAGALASPVIVATEEVVQNCPNYRAH